MKRSMMQRNRWNQSMKHRRTGCRLAKAGTLLFLVILATGCSHPSDPSRNSLSEWTLLGLGERTLEEDGCIRLAETAQSKGLMLISPFATGQDCVLRYEVQAVTDDTVLVALLSLSDPGPSIQLTPPENYDGSIGWILNGTEGYFIAFCNKPHNRKPFIRKLPHDPNGKELSEASRNYMAPRQWYQIEAGRKGDRVYFKLDGETLIEITDSMGVDGGHAGLRIRGTKNGPADCRIRNFEVIR